MRFAADKALSDPVYVTFMEALGNSVYYGMRHIHLSRSQKQQWAGPILSEIHDILAGVTCIAGRTGAIRAILMIATDSAGRERILGGDGGIQLEINENRCDAGSSRDATPCKEHHT